MLRISCSNPGPGFVAAVLFVLGSSLAVAQECATCHSSEANHWGVSPHANTQTAVAGELAQSHPGETPGEVIAGEDCIACHSPTAVLANGGMSEAEALGYFFTTSNGQFTASTSAANTALWPHAGCATCHFVPTNHMTLPGSLVFFDSQARQYVHMTSANQLCGQCHGSLQFPDTDHRLYDAWAGSRHALTQASVAAELSQNHPGESPYDVIYGPNAENCIACHAPTSVLVTGGDEATALDYFFTTTDGLFTTNTVSASAGQWPGVGCATCHDPHAPGQISYFNSTTLAYEVMTNSSQLCGQCHGNLRFPDTDHLSYNVLQGTGGIGVPDQQLMPGVVCTDCHMHASDADGSNSLMAGGHSWAVVVPEADGQSTVSCISCHTEADPTEAVFVINSWKSDFQALDAVASANVARLAAAVQDNSNPAFQAALMEAQHNLTYAESDESGGFHNHGYLMALLQDANQKALSVPLLSATKLGTNLVVSWTGPGTLQTAGSVAGPWRDVAGAANPLTVPITSQTPCQFYRVRP